MELQKQIQYANTLGTILLMLGLVSIGIGVGHFLSIQVIVNNGCETQILAGMDPTTCQESIQDLNGRVTLSIVAGVVGMVSGGGILYYLRRNVP